MLKDEIGKKLYEIINGVTNIPPYNRNDFIFSNKYINFSCDMVCILMRLSKEFKFNMDDDFIDSLEFCTFGELEDKLALMTG